MVFLFLRCCRSFRETGGVLDEWLELRLDRNVVIDELESERLDVCFNLPLLDLCFGQDRSPALYRLFNLPN